MHGRLEAIIVVLHISGLTDLEEFIHGNVIEVAAEFGFDCNTQLSPSTDRMQSLIGLEPKSSSSLEVNGGELGPNMDRHPIHIEVFFTFLLPHFRMGTIKFREGGFG